MTRNRATRRRLKMTDVTREEVSLRSNLDRPSRYPTFYRGFSSVEMNPRELRAWRGACICAVHACPESRGAKEQT
jgi:hypothetical protein